VAIHDSCDARPFLQKGNRRLGDGIIVQRLKKTGQLIPRRGTSMHYIVAEAFEIDGVLE
jgi:hypothetical protein